MKLSEIQGPSDLNHLSVKELENLAEEIRHKIIDVMAVNGGHLGSNMGIVELMLALHAVFDSPSDKFIFDVSHQVYPHKLLTGRHDAFPTIRQYKGLSGFANPEESDHDQFYAGHAATAISLGLGCAKSRDLNRGSEYILPIVGDATFTCGLALEALNNIPKNVRKFITVLNDNDMAISTNVGVIASILSQKAKTSRPYFEQYGMRYVGPIDGHNIEELLHTLQSIKDSTQPVLLHVLTLKGKGLEIAENNPIPWHGCSPFDKVTGEKLAKTSSKLSFPKIFGKHLLQMAEKDPNILTINPATPLGSAILPLMDKYPERTLDVGIAEGHAVTFAGGAAKNPNMKVVCSIYSTFLQRAFDNVFHDVCLQKSPVIFGIDRAGIGTGDGPTHHGIYDISFLNAMPNMVITQPRDGQVLKELLESAFDYKRPTAIRYPNMGTEEGVDPIQKRPLGKGEILSQGSDVAIIALGHMCDVALDAQKYLAGQNISATVVDPVFVKPLDTDLLTNIFLSHKQVVTLEEHAVSSGLGSIINNFAIRNGFGNIPIRNFGIPDTFFHQGSLKEMHQIFGMDAKTVASQILKDYAEEKSYENSSLST